MALNKGYSLANAVNMNKLHPDTFEIPSEEERHSLKSGMFVKLIFKARRTDAVPERMWVRVFKRLNDKGVYEGALVNEPLYDMAELVQYEDVVMFKPENVVDIGQP